MSGTLIKPNAEDPSRTSSTTNDDLVSLPMCHNSFGMVGNYPAVLSNIVVFGRMTKDEIVHHGKIPKKGKNQVENHWPGIYGDHNHMNCPCLKFRFDSSCRTGAIEELQN